MPISASQWGSPLASKRALLIHGLTGSSDSWEGIAGLLVAEGFFVLAPNLLGHAWRRANNYHVSALAEDLRPYFAMDASYDVIIGHSLGGAVVLSLLPFLPEGKETTVILVDPALEISTEEAQMYESFFLQEVTSAKTVDQYMSENPAWSRRDCVSRTLGLSMCDSSVIKDVFRHNKPWSFGGLLTDILANVKVITLVADPEISGVCRVEHLPHGVKVRVLPGIGHCIQNECPEAIMDVILLPSGKI